MNNWGPKINSSSSLTDKIYSILDNAKTEDIKIIDLRNKSSVADYFIISTCRSTRHADATADELSKRLKKLGYKNLTPEGRPKCDWVIVDAGLGAPSEAGLCMEMGFDAVLVNTAIAKADNPPLMAEAFKHAVESGRAAYFAGRIQRSEVGNPSSPTKFLSW